MARILLIDDDAGLHEILGFVLRDAGHEVLAARDGNEGFRRLREDRPELVVTDVVMPGLDGLSLVRKAREAGFTQPMILLTSRDDELDQALGLELGADDYVAKPFSNRVLVARIAALLRRDQSRREDGPRTPFRAGDLELDPERLEVRWRGERIDATFTEFRVVEALARRPGVVFSRERLLERVRGDDSVVGERIVDTYVQRLRKRFGAADPAFDRIETVVGAGYRWRDR